MKDALPNVVNVAEAEEHEHLSGPYYGQVYRVLTPALEGRPGALGVNQTRVPPGRTGCPFHAHQIEDEVFIITAGTGVFRYGEDLTRVRGGDVISCPAGTGVAHQLYNDGSEDLVYFAIGRNDPNEVCVYPDSGKVMVRSLNRIGQLENVDYMEGEPSPPRIVELARSGE